LAKLHAFFQWLAGFAKGKTFVFIVFFVFVRMQCFFIKWFVFGKTPCFIF